MNSTISPSVRDVAVLSPLAVSVLERHGIDYCCGGQRPFEMACAEKGIQPEVLMKEIEDASSSHSTEKNWMTTPLAELTKHILNTHHVYARRELPMLGQRMATVLRVHGTTHGDVLQPLSEVFARLRLEFEIHMQKEELVLFPSIERVAEEIIPARIGRPNFKSPVHMMEEEHDSAGAAFTEMRRLTNNFTPPANACTTFRALYAGLEALEKDTHQHVHLENNILFPRILELNRKTGG